MSASISKDCWLKAVQDSQSKGRLFTPQDQRAALLGVAHLPFLDAARKLGVSTATLYRWRFNHGLRLSRSEAVNRLRAIGIRLGRPRKISDEQIAATMSLSATEAARRLGIVRQHVYYRRDLLTGRKPN